MNHVGGPGALQSPFRPLASTLPQWMSPGAGPAMAQDSQGWNMAANRKTSLLRRQVRRYLRILCRFFFLNNSKFVFFFFFLIDTLMSKYIIEKKN